MSERPILFSAPMVRAILAGTKTQTRRVLTPQPELAIMDAELASALRACQDVGLIPKDEGTPRWRWRGCFAMPWPNGIRNASPYGVPGDRLWVRETFYCDDYRYPDAPIDEMSKMLEYRADHECRNWEAGCPCRDEYGRSSWRPSIHMPRWASRITLEVTGVRVERLQDISGEDAIAEGITIPRCNCEVCSHSSQMCTADQSAAILEYRSLWDTINGKRPGCSWTDNPWVWVIEFVRR